MRTASKYRYKPNSEIKRGRDSDLNFRHSNNSVRSRAQKRYMRRRNRGKGKLVAIGVILAVLLVCVTTALLKLSWKDAAEPMPEATKDPHEGQVYLYDGFDWVWMTPLESVPVNDLKEEDFSVSDGKIVYTGTKYDTFRGIDVSEHQKVIDWKKVADSGIDYAYIRVGRRGYTEGGLFDDAYFNTNIREAQANGLMTGVYMFSQAVTVEEAVEEANYLVEKVKEYNVTMPVAYDWEKIYEENARTSELDTETRTACAVAFCETVKNAGYVPCVYINRNMGYYGYDLSKLTDYQIWFSLPESSFPNFYYHIDMWQYSFTESVPGISVETDMNLWFVPKYNQIDEQTQ